MKVAKKTDRPMPTTTPAGSSANWTAATSSYVNGTMHSADHVNIHFMTVNGE